MVDGPLPTKEYKDACMSPIGTYESQSKRNSTGSGGSSEPGNQNEILASKDNTDEQGFIEIGSQEIIKDIVGSDKDADGEEEAVDGGEIDIVDGLEEVKIGIAEGHIKASTNLEEEESDAFPTSEVFYDHVRRGSSCLPEFEKEVLLSLATSARNAAITNEDPANDSDEFDDEIERAESLLEYNVEYMAVLEEMKTLYFKLVDINSRGDTIEEGENVVTMDMINAEVDKLARQLSDSDDSKMIKKCFGMFSEKEKRLPLNMCIQNILNEKKDIHDRLIEKSKNIDQMVYDLWNHQQDMKNIEKLKKSKVDLHAENVRLRKTIDEVKVTLEQHKLGLEQKDLKIEILENKLKEQEDKRQQFVRRPVPQPQRRTSTASQLQTSRRPNQSVTGAVPPMSLVHNTYPGTQLQSPRTSTATSAYRKMPITRK